jgi:imidazolonepropionase-like amidohydrolase
VTRPRLLVSALALLVVVLAGGCAGSPAPAASSAPAAPATPAASPAAVAKIAFLTAAPAPLGADDRVAFTLYKFLGEIGAERDSYVALPDGGTEAKAVFSYRDRMATVPLAVAYDIAADGSLRRFVVWGRTSRFTILDDRVVARADGSVEVTRRGHEPRVVPPSREPVVVASGYAPMLGQELLLRAWNQRGRPKTMRVLPEGEVTIEPRGLETYDVEDRKVTLEHVAITGLVWGREDAWLDDQRDKAGDKAQLAAVVTRDAEFDHHEAVREGFEALLPQLARSAGSDGVAALAEQARIAQRGEPGVLALVGGRLIDGRGGPPIDDSVVVVDGARIVAAGARGAVTLPPGTKTIDFRGKTVLPGLWDMHAHVEQVEQLAVYLASGVTTVRDMGNILDFITGIRDAIDAGKGLGPRVLAEGLVDGDGPGALGVIHLKTVADVAPTIDRLQKAGCLDVKIYSSVPPALVKPIAAYAHAHGMHVVGHVPEGMTVAQAIAAGFDSISHIGFLTDVVLPDDPAHPLSREVRLKKLAALDLGSPAITEEIDSLAARHIVIDDTMSLEEQLLHSVADNARLEPGIATLPRELEATLGGLPPALGAAGDAGFGTYLRLLGMLHRRGVPIVAGTDINVPGHSLHRELELYVKAGFTPMEAIQAATIVPAKMMRLDREVGTVVAGKRADLVVVDGDPLADIRAIRRTSLVITRGRVYDPAALWKLAGFHPEKLQLTP